MLGAVHMSDAKRVGENGGGVGALLELRRPARKVGAPVGNGDRNSSSLAETGSGGFSAPWVICSWDGEGDGSTGSVAAPYTVCLAVSIPVAFKGLNRR